MSLNRQQLVNYLQAGATLITPTNRLAQTILSDYLPLLGQRIIAKPQCLAYQSFLQQSYKVMNYSTPELSHPLLLTEQQVRYLWQQILATSNQGFVKEVQKAWTRCLVWQVEISSSHFDATHQTKQFQRWCLQLHQQLHTLNALTIEQIVPYLLTNSTVSLAKTVVWVCFDDFNPQQHALQSYLTAQGCEQIFFDLATKPTSSYLYAASDEKDEQQQLLLWIKKQLSEGKEQLGIIIPDLQQQAKNIQHLFLQHFEPTLFHLSVGQAMTEYSLTTHALCWLNLDNEQLSQHQASLLLRSPYLAASQTELLKRSQFLQDSYQMQERVIALAALIKELSPYAPTLATLLKKMHPYPALASPQIWATLFYQRLFAFGFPGEYALDSASYQCYQRFLLLFDEFKQLHLFNEQLSQQQALQSLQNLAQTTIFQPQQQKLAPLQIMGILEAAGTEFDALWVMGLSDDCVPQKIQLSAFIPLALQRDKLMPHANLAHEFQLAQTTLTRLQNASELVILSYPQFSQDKPNLPTPLLKDLTLYQPPSELAYAKSKQVNQLQSYEEAYLLPLTEQQIVGGGTTLLANQAKCPFSAFAAHRLHAKRLNTTTDGPNLMERGIIIHKVMELIWQQLKNQAALLALSEQELIELIAQAINTAIQPYQFSRTHSFSSLIQQVERYRLQRLVASLVLWEKQRTPFVIAALEQQYHLNIGGIDLQVRVDRLDELINGDKWVIDYKSSLANGSPWKDERPTEPQLLLYALVDEQIKAILFAELKKGQLTCKGLSAKKEDIIGLSTLKEEESWDDYRQNWQQTLTELISEFKTGHCIPKPLAKSICQQCDYQSLCRFDVNH